MKKHLLLALLAVGLGGGCVPSSSPSPDRDAAYIESLIEEALDAGESQVVIPAGTYRMDYSIHHTYPNFDILGEGVDRTILQAVPGLNDHVLHIHNTSNSAIGNLTIEGTFPDDEVGHCLRGAEISQVDLYDLKLLNCPGYGLGFQAGTIEHLNVSRVQVLTAGADGIDFKNKNNTNNNIYLDEIWVDDPGARNRDEPKAGIDLRGPVVATNITITGLQGRASGVRFRHGEVDNVNGLGAHGARLEGFEIECFNQDRAVGVDVVARDTQILYGSITGCFYGIAINDLAGDNTEIVGVSFEGNHRNIRD